MEDFDAYPAHARMFSAGKKRVLTLDGGGTRGVISIAFLKEMETQLRNATGRPDLVLSDVFDFVAGTSVGSMLAAMVALGRDVDEIDARFNELAPRIFSGRMTIFQQKRFDARPLVNGVRSIVKDATLGSPELKAGLSIIAKRVDTGSPWVMTNNPRMPYYDDGPDWDGNRHYKLESLIRASTAAPFLFTPTQITIAKDKGKDETGWFVDGGVSPHNNPSVQMLMMAGLPAYHLNWTLSPDDLLMISVGTGTHRTPVDRRVSRAAPGWLRPLSRKLCEDIDEAAFAAETLRSVIADTSAFALKLLQSVSHPRFSWKINSEIGSLEDQTLLAAMRANGGQDALLRFQRYDLPMDERPIVDEAFDIDVPYQDRVHLRPIDAPENIATLRAWSAEAARKQVSLKDFDGFL